MNSVSSGEKQSSFLLDAVTAVISGAFWDKNTWWRRNVDCVSAQGKIEVSHNLMAPAKTCIFPAMQMNGFVSSFSFFHRGPLLCPRASGVLSVVCALSCGRKR